LRNRNQKEIGYPGDETQHKQGTDYGADIVEDTVAFPEWFPAVRAKVCLRAYFAPTHRAWSQCRVHKVCLVDFEFVSFSLSLHRGGSINSNSSLTAQAVFTHPFPMPRLCALGGEPQAEKLHPAR
jgi:hypothetical protein